jgi:hypothetical protein
MACLRGAACATWTALIASHEPNTSALKVMNDASTCSFATRIPREVSARAQAIFTLEPCSVMQKRPVVLIRSW